MNPGFSKRGATGSDRPRLGALTVWPLPALLGWGIAWASFLLAGRVAGVPAWMAMALGVAAGAGASGLGATRWRRLCIALGFPLSLAASGLAAGLPAWSWLLPLGLLALVYPVNAWRDAPVFPTPRGALAGLASHAPLPPSARILDAGCGLGDGLRELRCAYPAARLDGLEWSWPLRWFCAWRCRDARVRRGDIWKADWSGYDLVYLFQRPESMAGAFAKAGRELRGGAWLASLEFPVPGIPPTDLLNGAAGRPVWLYRLPARSHG